MDGGLTRSAVQAACGRVQVRLIGNVREEGSDGLSSRQVRWTSALVRVREQVERASGGVGMMAANTITTAATAGVYHD
jgi:hypothetical protein